MNTFFPEIKKNFGFGCMRFPMVGEEIDEVQVAGMVDALIASRKAPRADQTDFFRSSVSTI